MGLLRLCLGILGAVLGAYTLYAIVEALRHGTNPVWVGFVGVLMTALSVLLLRAARDVRSPGVGAPRQPVVIVGDAGAAPVGWRAWVTGSAAALRVSRSLCVVAGLGLAITAALILATLVLGRPVGHAGLLVIAAVPAVAAGQAWGIAILTARQPSRKVNWRAPIEQLQWPRRGRELDPARRDPRRFFFEGLPLAPANALLAVAMLGWLTGMLTFPSLRSGGPTSPAAGCPYRLENHGSFTCVSRATYIHVGAAEQRFAAAILLFFFVLHLGVSAAELARRA
jgi:hypothetical protein